MELIILGCHGPYPPAGGACSGYLVREGDSAILLDCGNGVLSRLQEYMPFGKLDAVFLSHLHADHLSDLLIMRYGLEIAYSQGVRSDPLPLYAPTEPLVEYERLPYKNAYELKPISENKAVRVGPFIITFKLGVHAVPAYALRVETSTGLLVYSGDTEAYPVLRGIAAGADIFLCEANYLESDLEAGLPNHLSAGEAARIAAEAGVKRLLLTHLHPERDAADSLAEAHKFFPAAELAQEGQSYRVEEI